MESRQCSGVGMFTAVEVLRIRKWIDTREKSPRAIAAVFACSLETVRRIGRRETYAHVPEAGKAPELGERHEPRGVALGDEPSAGEVKASLARFLAAQGEVKKGDVLVEELKGERK